MKVYENIPSSLHYRVKKILGLANDEDYIAYLDSIKSEAKVYIKTKLDDEASLDNDQTNLAIDLYIQYQMFAKTENEAISHDKIVTLDGMIESVNQKWREKNKDVRKVRGLRVY
ncbi:MAG: hypothetical protein ACRC92_19575 [Peptostreptococcaceae bacterium]